MVRSLLATSLLIASTAHGAVHYVNSSTGPFTTIQSAIAAAAPGDEIFIQDIGMHTDYNEDIDFLGKDIIVRSDPANFWSVAIVGTGLGPVVTMASGEPPTAELSDLFVKGGNAAPPLNAGGGILIHGSSGRLVDVVVNHCTGMLGGGVAVINSQADLYNVEVVDNNGPSSGLYGIAGGGIFIDSSSVHIKGGKVLHNRASMGGGVFAFQSRLRMLNVDIEYNEAEEGGGLHLGSSAYTTTVEACRFNRNLALTTGTRPSFGAGVFAFDSTSIFEFCNFDGNQNLNGPGGNMGCRRASVEIYDSSNVNGQASDGGGIYLRSSRVRTERSHYSNNLAVFRGGGVGLSGRSTDFHAMDCRFDGNNARRGGGIAADNDTNLRLDLCQLIQNFADLGGGIFTQGNYGTRLVADCTLSGNDAGRHGGGIATVGAARFHVLNTSIDANRAANDGAGIWARGCNLLLDNSNCCFNIAGGMGGGIRSISCTPMVQNSVVSNNAPTEITGPFTNIASSIGSGC